MDEDLALKLDRILRFNRNSIQRGFARISLVALLENAVQSNIQVTVLAMFKYLSVSTDFIPAAEIKQMEIQTVFSVSVSVYMAIVMMFEMSGLLSFCYWTYTEGSAVLKDDEFDYLKNTDQEKYKRITSSLRDVKLSSLAMIGILAMLTGFNMYAVIKMIAAFRCKDSLWNITGCVDMGSY
jgi:hypothetical protein